MENSKVFRVSVEVDLVVHGVFKRRVCPTVEGVELDMGFAV